MPGFTVALTSGAGLLALVVTGSTITSFSLFSTSSLSLLYLSNTSLKFCITSPVEVNTVLSNSGIDSFNSST